MKGLYLSALFFVFILQSCSYLPEQGKMDFNYVQQETSDYVIFAQENKEYDTCFVFIPGGLVDPNVYQCWINELIKRNNNFSIILVKIPSNLAILNQNKIERIINTHTNTKVWILGGHSLGGVVASSTIFKNQDKYSALILMASWPIEANTLENWQAKALSISATRDGLATPEEIEKNKIYLPSGIVIDTNYNFTDEKSITYYFMIEGGNHSGFGCYGFQKGDNEAEIIQEEQQNQFIVIISKFIKSL